MNYKTEKADFYFLDETGLIHSERDKFFAIGIVKCSEPHILYNKIRKIRDKYRYYEEIKWAKMDRQIRFKVATKVFHAFIESRGKFYCIILDKEKLDFKKYYENDLFKVYRNFTISLLKIALGKKPETIIVLLADNYFSPDGSNFEEIVRKFTNDHYKKFVVAGVCQIDSKSNDILQLTDLILGSIIYDLKKQQKLIHIQGEYKRKFLNFLYQKMDTDSSFFLGKKNKFQNNYISKDHKIMATIFDCQKSKRQK